MTQDKSLDNVSPSASETWRVFKSIVPMMVLTGLFAIGGYLQADVTMAMWRSLIECPAPAPSSDPDLVCPLGSLPNSDEPGAATACLPVPKSHRYWTGSQHCMDYNLVLTVSTKQAGMISPFSQFFKLIGPPLLGVLVAHRFGNKYSMVLSLCSTCLSALAWLVTVHKGLSMGMLMFLAATQAIQAFTNLYHIGANAMLAQVIGPNDKSLNLGFSMLHVCISAFTMLGFVFGYLILEMKMERYYGYILGNLVFFVVMPILGLAILPGVQANAGSASEKAALASGSKLEPGPGDLSLDGQGLISFFAAPFLHIYNDTWLTMIFPLLFLENSVTTGMSTISMTWSMSKLGFSQATASFVGIVQPACMLAGSVSCGYLSARYNASKYVMYYAAGSLVPAGFILMMFSPVVPNGAVLYWLGCGPLNGFSFGVSAVCFASIIVSRTPPRYHLALFAIQAFFGTLGDMIGVLFMQTHVLPALIKAEGIAAGYGFLGCAVVYGACVMTMVLIHLVKVRPEDERRAIAAEMPEPETAHA